MIVGATIVDVAIARHRLRVRRTIPRTLSRGVARTVARRDRRRRAGPHRDPPGAAGRRGDRTVGRARHARRARHRAPAGRRGAAAGHRALPRPARPRALHVLRRRRSATVGVPGRRRRATARRRAAPRTSSAIPASAPRGPLGLGTDFESIRDYLPDDDVRQINWTATDRVGRPMSNVYRIEQDRDVVCLLDAGRLMAAPLDARTTRLDAAVDAVTMVALVADELGDRCGVTVFDAGIRSQLRPRRNGGRAVVRAILDAEPTRGRQRLRPRVPPDERRQAFAHPRVHRSRRRVGRAFARRRGSRADAAARGHRRVGARPRSRRRAPARARDHATTSTRPRLRSTCSTSAGGSRRVSSTRAHASSRRRRARSAKRACAPICGSRPERGCSRRRLRRTPPDHQPPIEDAEAEADDRARP